MSSKILGISIDKEDLVLTEVLSGFKGPTYTSWRINGFMSNPSERSQEGAKRKKPIYKEIVLSWPRERTIIREMAVTYADLRELREALKYQIDSILPFKCEDVYYDLYQGGTSSGRVLLVAVKKEELDHFLERLAIIGIVPSSVIISPMSYIPFQQGRDQKLALIQRAEAYSYTLLEGAKLARTLFIENEGAVLKLLKIDQPKKILLCIKNEDIAGCLLASLEGQDFTFAKDYYESLGAAIFRASESFPRFNLLGPGERSLKGAVLVCCILVALMMVFSVFIPVILKKKASEKLAVLESKIARLKPEVTHAENIRKYLDSHSGAINKVNELKEAYVSRLATIEELTKLLPKDAWIKELNLSRNSIEIEGFASAATDLVPAFEMSHLFSDAVLVSPITKDAKGKERFRLRAAISPKKENVLK